MTRAYIKQQGEIGLLLKRLEEADDESMAQMQSLHAPRIQRLWRGYSTRRSFNGHFLQHFLVDSYRRVAATTSTVEWINSVLMGIEHGGPGNVLLPTFDDPVSLVSVLRLYRMSVQKHTSWVGSVPLSRHLQIPASMWWVYVKHLKTDVGAWCTRQAGSSDCDLRIARPS